MNKKTVVAFLGCVLVVAAGLAIVGCEDASTGAGAAAIAVEPAATTLTDSPASVVLKASEPQATVSTNIFLPLRWSVTDESLGSISGQGGWSAVYTRTSKTGVNTILVKDQGSSEGVATVTQE